MQMIEISKGYAYWDKDNPECLNASAFGFTSQIINLFF